MGFQNVLSWMISLELENILSSSIGLTKQFLSNFQNGIFTTPQVAADATGWRVKPIKNPRTLLRVSEIIMKVQGFEFVDTGESESSIFFKAQNYFA